MDKQKIFALLLALALVQPANSVEFQDPRPLVAAIKYLQQTYRIAINYEDPPFQHEGDSVDVTDAVQNERQRQANPSSRIRVPRGGTLSIPDSSILIRQGVADDAMTVLSRLLVLHETAGLPGKFVLQLRNGVPTVIPTAVKNTKGEWTAVTSILDQPVSFPQQERSAAELVELILREVTKRRGIKVELAAAPLQLFLQSRFAVGANEQTAASILGDVFQDLSRQAGPAAKGQTLLSYRLLFDSQLSYYLLTVSPVLLPVAPLGFVSPATSDSGKLGGVQPSKK
jgi:hypothetical protein